MKGTRGYGSVTYGDVSMAARWRAARGHERGTGGAAGTDTYPGGVGQRGPQASSTPPDVLKHCKEPHL
ncbi:hypothetical protein GCM10010272_68930 [Streptomyces lateritius]|nr:hypothetical protein GCM10010272_68930 [Streptomyces lateritius]